jgi:hypothetical protein
MSCAWFVEGGEDPDTGKEKPTEYYRDLEHALADFLQRMPYAESVRLTYSA